MNYALLKRAIQNRKLTVAVVGLGYVGVPTSIAMAQAGITVIGIDIDAAPS